MKFLFASDSFKGTILSKTINRLLSETPGAGAGDRP